MRLNLLRPERKPPAPKVHAFLAVHYDDGFLDEVAALARRLRGDPRLSDAKWVSRSNLQTTIKFFLNTTDSQRQALLAVVGDLAAAGAESPALFARIRPSTLRGLPSSDKAHFLVVDVQDLPPGSLLGTLQARAEAAAVGLGYAPSRQPADPLLKLAHMTPAVDLSHLGDAARSLPPGRLTAISLHASSPNQTGEVQNRYDVIASARFRAT